MENSKNEHTSSNTHIHIFNSAIRMDPSYSGILFVSCLFPFLLVIVPSWVNDHKKDRESNQAAIKPRLPRRCTGILPPSFKIPQLYWLGIVYCFEKNDEQTMYIEPFGPICKCIITLLS